MSKHNRRTTINFPVFGYEVHLILAADIERTGRRLGVSLAGAYGAFVTTPDSMRGWIVLSTEPNEGTIAHEASHAVRAMFATTGARCDNEAFAYHVGYLVTRIHRFMKGTR